MDYYTASDQLACLNAFYTRVRALEVDGYSQDDARKIAIDEGNVARCVEANQPPSVLYQSDDEK